MGDNNGDTRGEDYAQRLRELQEKRWKQVLDVQRPYRWNMRRQDLGKTLDVGCGIGRNLLALPPGSLGVDHNEAAVAEARRRGADALTTQEWATSDRRVPESFDGMLLAHVIEHMDADDATALIQEYLPYVKTGGRVFFVCPQARGYASDPTHVQYYDLEALENLARRAGLRPERSFSFPFPLPAVMGRLFIYNEFCVLSEKVAA